MKKTIGGGASGRDNTAPGPARKRDTLEMNSRLAPGVTPRKA
jgi:hypothetical protein